ncbi:uncharacterized protein Fot_19748 [Forsythia ovata]|uniref:Uncharacterized protein n=1 Tax=Forsythia ovata TaxID=205694 RepID=A0ABD1VMA1_9LAMI
MASVANVTVSSTGARLLSLPRTLASSKGCCSFISSSKCYSKLGFSPLQHRSRALPSRKLLIRAARTESKGVSLGFRAPEFELPEPLTGKVWKLEDFESHPALLVQNNGKFMVFGGVSSGGGSGNESNVDDLSVKKAAIDGS